MDSRLTFFFLVAVAVSGEHASKSAKSSLCVCSVNEKKVPLLKLSVYDIDKKFPGDCRQDRAKAAITAIAAQLDEIKSQRENFRKCRKELRYLAYEPLNFKNRKGSLFYRVDECTVHIECTLPAWTNILEKKKCKLEEELKWYAGTYGKIWDYGQESLNKAAGIWH